MYFRANELGTAYPDIVQSVLEGGMESKPRGLRVKELTGFCLELRKPQFSVVRRPGHSKALMYLEIAQLLAGKFRADLYQRVSPQAAALLTPFGAYGPRTMAQLADVIVVLEDDPDSRRAVVMVADREDVDIVAIRKMPDTDQPCTLTWQFLLRQDKLEMIVNMRSWDLVWGLSYDVPCFTAVQRALAWCLGVEVGKYVHLAGSAHVYERHFDLKPERNSYESYLELLFPPYSTAREMSPMDRWDWVTSNAEQSLDDFPTAYGMLASAGEAWEKYA